MELDRIVEAFGIENSRPAVQISSGHINQTFLLEDPKGSKWILQNINKEVFKEPTIVMSNLDKVLTHLRDTDYPYPLFQIHESRAGKAFLDTPSGFWRILSFIEGHEALVKSSDSAKVKLVAEGYGNFLKYVNQLSPDAIGVTIPHFHDPERRFQQFVESTEASNSERLDKSQSLIDHAMAFSHLAMEYAKMCEVLPLRITHGDTKSTNIMVDTSFSKVVGVIDLDTVMPGYLMNDFGDMVRSMCNTGKEDDTDLGQVGLDVANFEGITRGFFESIHELIDQNELDSMLTGIRCILYEQFIRFLADYLNNDVYYQISHPEQNLDRARVHLKLLLDFQAREDQFLDIMNKCLAEI